MNNTERITELEGKLASLSLRVNRTEDMLARVPCAECGSASIRAIMVCIKPAWLILDQWVHSKCIKGTRYDRRKKKR